MPKIELTNISKRWGKFYGVDHLDLTIDDNAFITLLGPSGCGKTTILRMIAGLETPTEGRIVIGDTVVFDSVQAINVPPNRRRVGFLFQNYALWPNMTVYENIAFGLSNIKEEMAKVDYDAKNADVLAKILAKPEEAAKILEESKDKKGRRDENRALVRIMDRYNISMYTAKKLLAYGIEKGKNFDGEIRQLNEKVEQARKSHKDSGFDLNEDFEITKNGKAVCQERKLNKEEIDLAVRRVSKTVKIGMFMDRYPAELSGGQQQRVAIARTLAPEPAVMFMDEPLSNLDAKLRLEMRYELQRLHVETGSTFVYVTHDQMEAMTLATKICLLNNGVLQQYETPLTVYNRPSNIFVADFVGNPSINFSEVKAKQKGENIELDIFNNMKCIFKPGEKLNLKHWFEERDKLAKARAEELEVKSKEKNYVEKENKDELFQYHVAKIDSDILMETEAEHNLSNDGLVLGIRPEYVEISDDGKLEGEIYGAMPTGMESTIKLRIGDYLLTAVVFGSTLFKIGQKIKFNIAGNDILLFDRLSGKMISYGSVEFI